MPLTRFVADAFGVATITLFALFVLLGLFCIFQSLYFRLRIQRGGLLQLGYFNRPWITRVALILISIWWGIGEIVRQSFLERRLFSELAWQRNVCKAYILSNLGFAEPIFLLAIVFLLRAALQKRESGTLSRKWNGKTVVYIFLFCIPVFILQALLVLIGHRFLGEENRSGKTRLAKYFTRTYFLVGNSYVCTYPLFGTIVLGLFYSILISYILYIGSRMLSLVINKGLRRRISWLISSVLFFLPLRALLLGFSVLTHPGDAGYDTIVFLAFVMMLSCAIVGIVMLVYYPVADSLALRDLGHRELVELMPYDDYYYDDASLIANRSHNHDLERNSDASTKRGSISFRTMVGSEGLEETGFSSRGAFHIGSPSGSSPSTRPMLPLRKVPGILDTRKPTPVPLLTPSHL